MGSTATNKKVALVAAHTLRRHLRRAAWDRLGKQRVLPAVGKRRQPTKDRALVKTVDGGYARYGLAVSDRFDRLHSNDLKRVLIKRAAVG